MKVLLIKDVKSLGKAGEIKEVKDGYGNNFLIAKGFAKSATNEVIKKYEADKKRLAQELEYEIATLNKLKQELEKIQITIKKQVGANGTIFGSITKDEVANALKDQHNIEIDKKTIALDHIKNLGLNEVNIKFGHSINAKLKIEVVGE